MALDFVALDFETAAGQRDSACSISLVRIRDGCIVDQFSSLINPECAFTPYNIHIHHITPEMVSEAPKFPDIAPLLCDFIGNDVIAAHNASFDLDVFCKMFLRYGLPLPAFRYICTYQTARSALPDLINHKLATVCESLAVPLEDHHNSLCDTLACANVLISIAKRIDASSVEDLCKKLGVFTYSLGSSQFDKTHNSPAKRKEAKAAALAEWEKKRAARLMEEEKRKREREERQHQREAAQAAKRAEIERRRIEREEKRAQREAEKAAALDRTAYMHPVMQLTDDGQCVNTFPSVAEAARAMSIDKKGIRDAANGKQRRAAGYRWAWCCESSNDGGMDMENDSLVQANALLDALKASKPDKAFAIEYSAMKDNRSISFKVAGGILCYMVNTRQSSYIKIDSTQTLEAAFPTAEHLTNGQIKLNMDMTFDMDAFVSAVGPLCESLFDASATVQFGCCNDSIRCSDAGKCLKLRDPDYRGCQYRKNLEAGRVFYGSNKNI